MLINVDFVDVYSTISWPEWWSNKRNYCWHSKRELWKVKRLSQRCPSLQIQRRNYSHCWNCRNKHHAGLNFQVKLKSDAFPEYCWKCAIICTLMNVNRNGRCVDRNVIFQYRARKENSSRTIQLLDQATYWACHGTLHKEPTDKNGLGRNDMNSTFFLKLPREKACTFYIGTVGRSNSSDK